MTKKQSAATALEAVAITASDGARGQRDQHELHMTKQSGRIARLHRHAHIAAQSSAHLSVQLCA